MIVKYASDGEGRMLVVPVARVGSSYYDSDNALLLMEGYNEIPIDDWDNVFPHIKDKIKSSELELVCKEEKVEGEKEPKFIQQPLEDIRADKARTIVKGCYNESNIRKWLEDTKLTSELRALCDMQLTAILAGAEVTR